jgi:hypothetical protein
MAPGNLYRESIQSAAREALAANIGEEQILQWVREVLTDAVDYYPGEYQQCAELSTP